MTRLIDLIGGMSWESSAEYYRLINQGLRDALGATHSARILLWSFDFAEIEALQHAGDWPALTALMVDAARRLAAAGAERLLICTNTMHRVIYEELVAGRIEAASRAAYRGVMRRLADRGAQAIVLGCTEITLLVGPQDSTVPLFDTTALHAQAAIDAALEKADR
jgi:aspartate/glutamate racemase